MALKSRRIELTGARNFRDIGGYRTEDGSELRWGKIYRSDSLADLTAADIQAVSSLGLRMICDLRHETERTAKPNQDLGMSEVVTKAIGFLPHRAVEMLAAARLPGATVAAFRAEVREVYRCFALQEIGTFRQLFELIEQEANLPMLIHCASGKDRTGFAVALLLRALGVNMATVVEDFLLSNQYRRDLAYLAGNAMPPDLLTAMMQVDELELAAAFDAAREAWGTDARFFAGALGLTPDRLEHLRRLLLHKPEQENQQSN